MPVTEHCFTRIVFLQYLLWFGRYIKLIRDHLESNLYALYMIYKKIIFQAWKFQSCPLTEQYFQFQICVHIANLVMLMLLWLKQMMCKHAFFTIGEYFEHKAVLSDLLTYVSIFTLTFGFLACNIIHGYCHLTLIFNNLIVNVKFGWLF